MCAQVASNRFKTRGGKAAAKFEARWANRKSRLAELEGFRYFSLFREVPGGCSSVAAWSQLGAVLSGCLGAWRAVAPATRTAQMRSILNYVSAKL